MPPRARILDNNKREGSIESEDGELATHRSMFQSCRWSILALRVRVSVRVASARAWVKTR
jgi:hypothetical protein